MGHTNSTNLGFPAAVNQGLKYARGEYLVLLNNDAVVTEGWLEQLIALTAARTGEEPGFTGVDGCGAGTSTAGPPPLPDFEASGAAGTSPPPASALGVSGSAETRPTGLARGIEAFGSAETSATGPPSPPTSCGDLSPSGRGGGTPLSGRVANGIGLVGPITNYAAPPQLVPDVPYRDLDEMRAFAKRCAEHRGQWFTVPKLSGFCLLMRRAVYEAIGGLDEQFGLGFFDDDDLAIRARQAGFELAVAHDLFVHHFGSRTFAGNGVDADRLLTENQQRFAAKWGETAPRGQRVRLRPFAPNGHGTSRGDAETRSNLDTSPGELRRKRDWRETELGETNQRGTTLQDNQSLSASRRLRARSVRVSLTMIVRNEEHNLPRCLESVRGLFDEIVIVDTVVDHIRLFPLRDEVRWT